MYFNQDKEDTNIDEEFKKKRKFSKRKLIIIGGIFLILFILFVVVFFMMNKNRFYITLYGDDNIILYQGTEFIEPGYYAYDKHNNDYTDEVEVTNGVDYNKIGEYEISYKFNDKIVYRNIKVIEKPDDITLIYLYGEAEITLNVGDVYEDPGYFVIDSVDGNLSDSVVVTGKVDTTKAGNYKLVYSVVNSEGVTTSVSRTVIVK